MALPFVNSLASSALVNAFKVDTLPELQEKTRNNSSLLERTLLPLLDDPSRVQAVWLPYHNYFIRMLF